MIDIKFIETVTLVLAAGISTLLGTKEVKNWYRNRIANNSVAAGTPNQAFCAAHKDIFEAINLSLQSIDRRLGNIESTLMKSSQ